MKKKLLFLLSLLLLLSSSLMAQQKDDEFRAIRKALDTLDFTQQEKIYLDFADRLKKRGDSTGYATVMRDIGGFYRSIGNYDLSNKYTLIAYGIFQRHGESARAASALSNLANTYYLMGDMQQALSYYHQVYATYLETHDDYIEMARSNVTLNMAQVYFELDSLRLARRYAEKSIDHIRNYSDTSEILWQYIMLGAIHQAEKKFEEARYFYHLALNNASIQGDDFILAMAYENLGLLFDDLGEKDSATFYLEEAIAKAYSSKDPEMIARIAQDLTGIYESRGDSLNAFQYLKVYTLFNDSLLNEKRIQSIIDAEKRYQAEAKAAQLEAQRIRLQQRKYTIFGLSLLLILLVIVSVLIIRNRNKSARLAKQKLRLKEAEIHKMIRDQELKSMEAMMKGQDEERKRIARDLHDRLGSMLSTVKLHFSSVEEEIKLLQQKQKTAYDSALDMLDEAVDEVRKISHNLHSGAIAKFGLKTAVNQLIQAIQSANSIRISFMDNGVDPELYQGIEVELYRIIQELLSNTLKHSGADEAIIQLNFSSGLITFSYEDNGKGMDTSRLSESDGLGMQSIESRVRKIGGTYSIDSRPGHGFTFFIEIPV